MVRLASQLFEVDQFDMGTQTFLFAGVSILLQWKCEPGVLWEEWTNAVWPPYEASFPSLPVSRAPAARTPNVSGNGQPSLFQFSSRLSGFQLC
jgi:hypothetical protein